VNLLLNLNTPIQICFCHKNVHFCLLLSLCHSNRNYNLYKVFLRFFVDLKAGACRELEMKGLGKIVGVLFDILSRGFGTKTRRSNLPKEPIDSGVTVA
jgi:hypothetical protein